MKKIVVASRNPVKIQSTLKSFQRMFPDEEFAIEGVSVESGVSDQPASDDETYQGAFNRATNASKAAPDADFWVGLEGGIADNNTEMEAYAWMVVRSHSGQIGKGKSGVFVLPPKVAELVRAGKELGEADDIVFNKTNSKQANGSIGILTHDVITRSDYYEEAMIYALIPFKNAELYPFPSPQV